MFNRIFGIGTIALIAGGAYYFLRLGGPSMQDVQTIFGRDGQITEWNGCSRRLNGVAACRLTYQMLGSNEGGTATYLTQRATLLFAYEDNPLKRRGWDLVGRDPEPLAASN